MGYLDQEDLTPPGGPITRVSNLPPTVASTTPPYGAQPGVVNVPNPLPAVRSYLTGNVPPAQLGGEGGADRGYPTPTVNLSPPGQREPVYENSVIRGAGSLQGSGPITNAASSAPAASAGTPSVAGPASNAPDSTAYNAMMQERGQNERLLQQRFNDEAVRNQRLAAAPGYRELEQARSAARVADFQARSGADVVLRGGTGTEAARYGQAAQNANARLAALEGQAAAAAAPPPHNYIDDYGKLQNAASLNKTADSRVTDAGARVTEAGARATEANAKAGLEREQTVGFKLSNEQHSKILSLADAMGKATAPEDVKKLERQILALTGKSSEDWTVQHLAGQSRVDANGMPAGKDADSALVLNKKTGEQYLINSQGVGKPPPSAADNATLRANANNKEVYDGFVKRFGEDVAKRVLGK